MEWCLACCMLTLLHAHRTQQWPVLCMLVADAVDMLGSWHALALRRPPRLGLA